jgi:PKD repeat protein
VNRIRVYGLTCVLLMVAGLASATTIVMPADEQLIAKAPIIVDGTVVSSQAVERNGRIWTETTVSVERTLKGEVGRTITVREIGGELGDRVTRVYGTPEFTAGEQVLLFLDAHPHGGYRTVDLFVGKFSRAAMLDGRPLWLRNDHADRVTLLDANFEPVAAQNVQRDAVKFEQFVRERLAGRAGTRNYGVANPILAGVADRGPGRQVEANFTLIAEPTVYRWFGFDNGGTANWYSGGTQTGYSGGGVSELQTAMAAWTSYGQANINYAYAGTRAAPWGGLSSRNGVNEVLFDDPNDEITGAFNRSTGGVVGTGGFNGITNGGNWTAPFAADPTHPAGTMRAWNIVEGNLTIQDGVTPSAGVSSSRLAEIVSHEFGHTLGIGHSADTTALMYSSVSGRGPSLRADDQVAARWLYPNGNVEPPPQQVPAAPSNLTAVVTPTAINLSWNDNSNNESGFYVYVSAGTGAFARVGEVDENTTQATLTGASANSYRIYVVAFNGSGNSPQSNTATVTVGSTLTAAFSVSQQTGIVNATTFTFYDESRGATQRSWDFGDGTSSTAAVVNKVYNRTGRFNVTLTVTGGGQSATTTQAITVTAALLAQFSFEPANPKVNETIVFVDESVGPTSWRWVFGDGQTSQAQNPNKRYSNAGTYNVTLTVFRGSESATVSRSVTVTDPAPVTPPVSAAFDFAPNTPAVGENVTFTDRSTGSPASWAWSFGDGRVSTSRNPVISYSAPGVYSVTLTASNGSNSATATRQVTVVPGAPHRSLISVTTQTSGLGGTSWRTDLTIFNAGEQGASVTLLFLPAAGMNVISRSLFLAPKQSVTYGNTLLDLFGVPNGAGAVAIEGTSAGTGSAQLRVSSRTYTDGPTGTYGQSVPDVAALDRTLYITGMQSNEGYRTNIGLVNRGTMDTSAALTLYDASGTIIGTENISVPASNFQQFPLVALFPDLGGMQVDVMSMKVIASTPDTVSAYASVIDNITQDPIYIQAVPASTGGALTIPVVGRAPGVNGTFWRSDVAFMNPSNERLNLNIRYFGNNKTLSLPARQTVILDDVLSEFGQSSGSGSLLVSWTNAAGPIVTSRTYTSTENGGTYGQAIDPATAFGNTAYVPGLRNDGSYRSNVGFVNGSDNTETFFVKALSPSGTEMASTTITVLPGGQAQAAISALFPNLGSVGNFTLAVIGDGDAKIFAYGSMVDNASGDPVFFAGR